MKTIPLTKGMVALVDDEDFEFLNHWSWHASFSNGNFYARRDEKVSGVRRRVYMHRIVSGAATGQYVDHKDRCTLPNLRLCSQSENMHNSRLSSRSTSGFKGVCFDKARNKWIAHQGSGFVGRFSTSKEAAEAYDLAAIKSGGEFALTNKEMRLIK